MSKREQIKKDFLLPKPEKDEYLEKIGRVVAKHLRAQVELNMERKKLKFRIGSFKDTIHKARPDLLEEWEEFYLPDHMRMEVIGVVEKFPCCSDDAELVLMVCEDGKVFGFEEDRLHLVSNSLKSIFEDGIQFPGTERYYRGQSFEDMTDKEWDKVKKSKEIIEKNKEHQNMLQSMKFSYLENLKTIRQSEPPPIEKGRDPLPVRV